MFSFIFWNIYWNIVNLPVITLCLFIQMDNHFIWQLQLNGFDNRFSDDNDLNLSKALDCMQRILLSERDL